jgi:hypothetical protein
MPQKSSVKSLASNVGKLRNRSNTHALTYHPLQSSPRLSSLDARPGGAPFLCLPEGRVLSLFKRTP